MKVNISKMTHEGRLQYRQKIRPGIEDLYVKDVHGNLLMPAYIAEKLDELAEIAENVQLIQSLAHWALIKQEKDIIDWLEVNQYVLVSEEEKSLLRNTPTTEQYNQQIAEALYSNVNLEKLTKAVITIKNQSTYLDYAALTALESRLQKAAGETFVQNEAYANWLTIQAQIALMLSNENEFQQTLEKLQEIAKSEDKKLKIIAAYNSFMLNCAYAQALFKLKENAEAGGQKQAALSSYTMIENNLSSMPMLKAKLSKAKHQLEEESVTFNFLPVYFRHSESKKSYFSKWLLILLGLFAITFLFLTLAAAIAAAGLTVPVLTSVGLFLSSSLGSFTAPLIIGGILSSLSLFGLYREYRCPGYLVSLCKRTFNADLTATTEASALEGIKYSKGLLLKNINDTKDNRSTSADDAEESGKSSYASIFSSANPSENPNSAGRFDSIRRNSISSSGKQ